MRRVLTLSGLGELGPHLLDALEDHVAVAVEGLHPPQQLLVVPAVDQDLRQREEIEICRIKYLEVVLGKQ